MFSPNDIWVNVNDEAEIKINVFGVLIKLLKKKNFVGRQIISNQMPRWLDIKETKTRCSFGGNHSY